MDTPPSGTPAPNVTPAATPAPTLATPAPAAPAPAQKTPEQLLQEKKALREKKKKKHLLIGLILMVGFVFFVVLLIAFFILSQSGSGTNPLLTLFGISEEQLYPFLINLTSMIFGLFDFIGFLLAIIGIFMIAMAKKEDTGRRKKGIGLLVAGMLFFMMFSVIWASSYFYLKAKKDQYTLDTQGSTQYIQTDPEDTTNLTAPATVEFDASELPVDTSLYTIISYVWDFGDGSTGTGATTSHRYTTKGEDDGRYIVTLTVTYRNSNTSEEAEEAFTVDVVFGNEQVDATFTATPESGTVPLEVEFDASESSDPDGEIVGYEWDLDGDGSYDDGDEVTAEYTYTQYGTYEAKLRVTDNNGETSTTTVEILVDEGLQPNGTIDVELEEDGTAYVGQSYYFDVSDASSPNGEIEKYAWDFGDGSTPTKNKTAKHTYEDAGTYTVTLTLTDEEGETGETTLEIEVVTAESAPTVVITTDQSWSDEEETTITGKVPFTVTFYGDESTDPDDNITNYEWDLDGDGEVDEVGEGTEYTYEETGTYKATLYIQDAAGSEVQGSITVVVESQGLNADITAATLTGEVPLAVTFDASGSSYPEGEIVNYFWEFGDGTTRYDTAEISYTYDEVGTFEAKVTAIASDGTEATDSLYINVMPVALTACFEPNVHSGVAPLTVTFNPGCAEGSVVDYRWDFGDGDISYARKPSHEFIEAGTYTVTLTVTDNEGVSDDYSVSIAVYSE